MITKLLGKRSLLLVVAALGVAVAMIFLFNSPLATEAHTSPPPGGTQNHVDLFNLPKTLAEAMPRPGVDSISMSPYIPGMGYHVVSFKEGVPQDPVMMYSMAGDRVGIEFFTKFYPDDPQVLKNDFGIDKDDPTTFPVPVPPWNGPMGPHPGQPANTIHWDLHIYEEKLPAESRMNDRFAAEKGASGIARVTAVQKGGFGVDQVTVKGLRPNHDYDLALIVTPEGTDLMGVLDPTQWVTAAMVTQRSNAGGVVSYTNAEIPDLGAGTYRLDVVIVHTHPDDPLSRDFIAACQPFFNITVQ